MQYKRTWLQKYLLRRDLLSKVQRRLAEYRYRLFRDAFQHQRCLMKDTVVLTVLDVGAHLGHITSKYLKLFPNAHIWAFEPFPETYEYLCSKFAGNDRVVLNPYAVSSENSSVRLNISEKSPNMNSLLTSKMLRKSIEVQSITLDTFCAANDISTIQVLKLDIQGGELAALNGSANLLDRKAVGLIYTEFSIEPFYYNHPLLHDIATFLWTYDYQLYGLYNIRYSPAGQLRWGDAIFIPVTH